MHCIELTWDTEESCSWSKRGFWRQALSIRRDQSVHHLLYLPQRMSETPDALNFSYLQYEYRCGWINWCQDNFTLSTIISTMSSDNTSSDSCKRANTISLNCSITSQTLWGRQNRSIISGIKKKYISLSCLFVKRKHSNIIGLLFR